ncbi:MAG TPA: helix-turn-helix domain-containing protein [Natronosporangium sp.]
MTTPEDREIVLDARAMRGIAHPLRVRLLAELRMHGPSTATRLGQRLGQSSGATSYHLRQLAAYGFVEEVPRDGGRERWWRAIHRSTRVRIAELDPETAELTGGWLRHVVEFNAEQALRAVDEFPALPAQWRGATAFMDTVLRLEPAEAERLKGEVMALLNSYRQNRPEAIADAPAGAAPVMAVFQLFRRADADPDDALDGQS